MVVGSPQCVNHDSDDYNYQRVRRFLSNESVDTFASRLKYARNLRHLSQAALARKCKLSQSAISSYESGARKDPSKILTLADVLEVNPYWLSEGQGPMFPAHPAGLSLHENAWPFASINPHLFWSLPLSDREAAEQALAAFIEGLRKARAS